MPNDDDMAAADDSTTSDFYTNFFPESRPASTITSSVHKKFDLADTSFLNHQAHAHPELSLIDRLITWAFEFLIVGLLFLLIRNFARHATRERNAANDSTPSSSREEEKAIVKAEEKRGGSKATAEGDKTCSTETNRNPLRFKSRDLKYVKKRKWVSTGPIMMAHGRDLSLSPEMKLMNLRNNFLVVHNPMLNPLPLLKANNAIEKHQEELKKAEQVVENQEEIIEAETVLECHLRIPVRVENMYNFKNFDVCFLPRVLYLN